MRNDWFGGECAVVRQDLVAAALKPAGLAGDASASARRTRATSKSVP
jgi:hypothetical protein